MTTIQKATPKDYEILTEIGKISFLESQGHCASAEDVAAYINAKYTHEILKEELNNPDNQYYILYHNGQALGYSKIIYNAPHPNIPIQNITKLDRIYLLKEFYGLNLGAELLKFNLELSKKNGQAGIWLFVWVENHRAIRFYEKNGFEIVGRHDFKISENHSNPNHQMFLKF